MRGRIIHYNGSDGRGLLAAADRQLPFEIAQWRSDTAPAVNATVELAMDGDTLVGVTRVPDDVLLKEKAGQIASRLGAAGGAALHTLAAPDAGAPRGWANYLGKPLLVAQAVFSLSALALPYLSIDPGFGGGRSYTLTGLSTLSEQLGASVGGAFWVWLAILSIVLPLAWKARWAWLALVLPLLATLKPLLDIASGVRKAASGMEQMLGSGVGGRMAQQLVDMLDPGLGLWICLLSALFIAALGAKRALLPPAA